MGPFGPDQRSFNTDVNFSNTLSEAERTPAHNRGAGASASELTPEKKTAVQRDGKLASQQTGEVFVDCGAAFDFDKKNDLNYFVRTITPQEARY